MNLRRELRITRNNKTNVCVLPQSAWDHISAKRAQKHGGLKKKRKKRKKKKEILGRSIETTSKKLIVQALYLDLEDLKQSKSDENNNNKN